MKLLWGQYTANNVSARMWSLYFLCTTDLSSLKLGVIWVAFGKLCVSVLQCDPLKQSCKSKETSCFISVTLYPKPITAVYLKKTMNNVAASVFLDSTYDFTHKPSKNDETFFNLLLPHTSTSKERLHFFDENSTFFWNSTTFLLNS